MDIFTGAFRTKTMKKLYAPFIPLIIALFMATACKGPETIVVDENPTPASPDTARQDTADRASASFRQLNIGELNPIPTLDPLFAENASTMRALQLIYEGLVRYDKQGNIIPAIAENWEVSSDSLTYTFDLHGDIFFHDHDIFASGIGRKLLARDVKFVFERMAKNHVPSHAAHLFMPLKGFEPYYREQQQVLNAQQRRLRGVSGISTPDDSTVVFRLVEKDPHFLQKLASPYAVIYPREAVERNPSNFKPVGSGPFAFSQFRNDSLLILSKYKNYRIASQPAVNRVDIAVMNSENELFKAFAGGDLHLIPEPGPQITGQVLNKEGGIMSGYEDSYKVVRTEGRTTYSLNLHSGAGSGLDKAPYVTQLVDSSLGFHNLPPAYVELQKTSSPDTAFSFSPTDTLVVAYTDNYYSRIFIDLLGRQIKSQNALIGLSPVRVPTRDTELYTSVHFPLYPGHRRIPGNSLVHFSVLHHVLSVSELKQAAFNSYPWWIDLRETTIPVSD